MVESPITVWPAAAGVRYVVATDGDRGFVVSGDELIANTRKGKQILNVGEGEKAAHIVPVAGDHVAIIGQNRKLLVFPLAQMPEMTRGKGVRLQRYRDGGIADVKTFALTDGLTWRSSDGRVYTVAAADLAEWIGNRAEAGRLPPKGFPKNNRFVG